MRELSGAHPPAETCMREHVRYRIFGTEFVGGAFVGVGAAVIAAHAVLWAIPIALTVGAPTGLAWLAYRLHVRGRALHLKHGRPTGEAEMLIGGAIACVAIGIAVCEWAALMHKYLGWW